MSNAFRAALLAVPSLFTAAVLGLGCVATQADVDDAATIDSDLLNSTAVSRAEEWVNAKLHYCQSANHARDYDSACSTYCERTDDKAWDPYRSDCSGLVSWAWELPAPGRVTGEFAPFQSDITHAIDASSLRAGDAVNNSEHVMLFKQWDVKGSEATFIEEPGCSSSTPYAHEFTSHVSINGSSIHVDWNGMTFTAIRYDGISTAAPAPQGPATPKPPKPTGCGHIEKGEGLVAGESFKSCDGRFTLSMQTDGNLVLYAPGDEPLWASGTYKTDGEVAVMQGDGNLVVYGSHSDPLWSSKTDGHAGATLAVQDDGNLVVYGPGGKALWASNTVVPKDPAAPTGCKTIEPGEGLGSGKSIKSCDGRYELVMQGDGNLVLYHEGKGALWASNTYEQGGFRAIMQTDGNFVLYDAKNKPLWASNTSGHAGAWLAAQDDGNLVVYSAADKPLWASNTWGK